MVEHLPSMLRPQAWPLPFREKMQEMFHRTSWSQQISYTSPNYNVSEKSQMK